MTVKAEKLRFYYGLFLSVWLIVVGVAFIGSVWGIYTSASESPFTRESISAQFDKIAPLVWIGILALLGNVALVHAYPEEEGRPRAYVEVKKTLSRAKKRLPYGEYGGEIDGVNNRFAGLRALVLAVCALLLVGMTLASCLLFLDAVYFPLGKSEFFALHDGLADRLMQSVILWAVAFAIFSVGGYLIERSYKKEQKRYLDILVKAKAGTPASAERRGKAWYVRFGAWLEEKTSKLSLSKRAKERVALGVKIGLGAVGVVLFVVGICNGGMADVFSKAINICTQCIGLG